MTATFESAGDPEAMRAAARALRMHAQTIRGVQDGPSAALDGVMLEGPSAGRLRGASGDARDQVLRAVGELEAVAGRLGADADRVQALNDERRRAAEAAAAQAGDAAAEPPASDAAAAAPAAGAPPPAAATPTPAPSA